MLRMNLRPLLLAALTGIGLAVVGLQVASAAQVVTYEACVVERKPSSALMTLGERVLFELDLRGVPSTPFALRAGECVTVQGLARDSEPGLRREFPQASWLVEAQSIQAAPSHLNPANTSNSGED
jgi:hypothetical protein